MINWFVDKKGARSALDLAVYDGSEWILSDQTSMRVCRVLQNLGLAQPDGPQWRLTPMGVACSALGSWAESDTGT